MHSSLYTVLTCTYTHAHTRTHQTSRVHCHACPRSQHPVQIMACQSLDTRDARACEHAGERACAEEARRLCMGEQGQAALGGAHEQQQQLHSGNHATRPHPQGIHSTTLIRKLFSSRPRPCARSCTLQPRTHTTTHSIMPASKSPSTPPSGRTLTLPHLERRYGPRACSTFPSLCSLSLILPCRPIYGSAVPIPPRTPTTTRHTTSSFKYTARNISICSLRHVLRPV